MAARRTPARRASAITGDATRSQDQATTPVSFRTAAVRVRTVGREMLIAMVLPYHFRVELCTDRRRFFAICSGVRRQDVPCRLLLEALLVGRPEGAGHLVELLGGGSFVGGLDLGEAVGVPEGGEAVAEVREGVAESTVGHVRHGVTLPLRC